MEKDLEMIYRGKRVLVTGHTGFKGSWLCEMLLCLGAEVHGFALPPPTRPAMFSKLGLARRIASHTIGDVRDAKLLSSVISRIRPDFIFHLAAQPLVRESYRTPADTFDVNVMGTVHLLDSCRTTPRLRTNIVCVTTDKCYENDDSGRPFAETSPMGGRDPYSASKGACELAISSFRRSFFESPGQIRVASARAGNVVGGGDWAADRLVPDAMRAFLSGRTLLVRNGGSTRPWQHVLEPLTGYLLLGASLDRDSRHASAYNFGPNPQTVRSVSSLVRELQRHFPNGIVESHAERNAPRESCFLALDSSKAFAELGWKSLLSFPETIRMTVEWYVAVANGENARSLTRKQIASYWAKWRPSL